MFKKNIMLYIFFLVLTLSLPAGLTVGEPGAGRDNETGDIYFTILHTNDEHSALFPSPSTDFHPEKENPSMGGAARLAGAINRTREEKQAQNEPVMVLNGGDFMGGTVYNWLVFDGFAPELTLMQQIGYDIVIIGNHEYDNGPDMLADYLKAAGYPEAHERTVLMATNTLIPEYHPLSEAEIKKTYIKELDNGLKLGFFSLIGEDAVGVTVDTGPLEFANRHETAAQAVAALKDEGADLVVAVNHSGIDEDRELAAGVAGIDIIVGGHSHTNIYEPEIIGDTIIVQAGGVLEYLGVLELAFNPDTGNLRVRNNDTGQPNLVPLDHTVPVDPEIEASVDIYTGLADNMISRLTGGRFTGIFDTVASSDFTLPNQPYSEENSFGNFLTDAMRIMVEEKTGRKVDVAFQGSGIIRSKIKPGTMDFSRGEINLYDLMEAVALGSAPDDTPGFPLAAGYLTGEEIMRVMEISLLAGKHLGDSYFLQVSGLRFDYDPDRIILFPIPGTSLPFPSVHAILNAGMYTGTGIQTDSDEDYTTLERGDRELYHVVTDYVLMSVAVEEAARQLPWLPVKPKDSEGNVVENMEDLIVRVEGEQYKVWQAALEYMAAQPTGEHGYPQIDSYYEETGGRITAVSDTGPLSWIRVYLAAFYVFLGAYLFIPAVIILFVVALLLVRRSRKAPPAGTA